MFKSVADPGLPKGAGVSTHTLRRTEFLGMLSEVECCFFATIRVQEKFAGSNLEINSKNP